MIDVLKQYEAHAQNGISESEEERYKQLVYIFEEYSSDKKKLRDNKYSFFSGVITAKDKWLAIGDHYGYESFYFSKFGLNVLPADICVLYLQMAKSLNYISEYSEQNAEMLTFANNTFDFVFCRDSYHHFPRPVMAVYEMLRVAKSGVIISEPSDAFFKSPILLLLCNILDTKNNPVRSRKIWKNRFSFETCGNYVYKVSQREFEKLSMGIGLPAIAFRYSNTSNHSENQNKLQRAIMTALTKIKLIPYPMLSTILFKIAPSKTTVEKLKKDGWMVYNLPKNPFYDFF